MEYAEIKSSAMNELKRMFRPEFINRVDEIVVFHSLSRQELRNILDIMLSEVSLRLFEMNIYLEVNKNAKEYLVEKGYDPKFGARPLRRLIQKEIEDPLSVELLKHRFSTGNTIKVTIKNNKIVFEKKKNRVPAVAAARS